MLQPDQVFLCQHVFGLQQACIAYLVKPGSIPLYSNSWGGGGGVIY
jgi:hypothetical protein